MGKYDAFVCYGHFYSLRKNNEVFVKCRSLLEMINNNHLSFEDLENSFPDALIIMMNPGTSKPSDSNYEESEYDVENFNLKHAVKDLTLTKPDETQYRVMDVMLEMEWNYVRVINLSDIRQKDSEYLNPEIKKFHRIYSTPLHSMFIPEREEEFNEIISSINSSPIIMAWGTQGCLLDFAKECVERTEVYDRYGVRSVQDNYFLIHPQNRRASVFYM